MHGGLERGIEKNDSQVKKVKIRGNKMIQVSKNANSIKKQE